MNSKIKMDGWILEYYINKNKIAILKKKIKKKEFSFLTLYSTLMLLFIQPENKSTRLQDL